MSSVRGVTVLKVRQLVFFTKPSLTISAANLTIPASVGSRDENLKIGILIEWLRMSSMQTQWMIWNKILGVANSVIVQEMKIYFG